MSVKAFELVPAVGRELLMADKALINIECIEFCGKHLYVGTSDCFIYQFLLEESASAKGKVTYSPQKLLHKYLGLKKPVSELRATSALERLIVLCDCTIMVVDMASLEPVTSSGTRIKGVLSFCVNENPVSGDPFCVEIGVILAKRRTVQIYMVYEDRVQMAKEVATPEQPCAVSLDGYFLCLALSTQYIILNYNTGASQDLFPYNSQEKKPIVKRVGREEFLLAAPGGLGMFATAEGISQRAPVKWSENVIGAAVCFPYVVALDDGFVTVHSMLDQQLKQTLSFRDGHILQDFEGKVVLASTKAVYVLVPLPLEKQIQDLLAGHHVEEALTLTEGARRNIPKEKFQVMYRRILQQAGFILFGNLQFLEAKEHFRKGQLDARELISLYPLLLPATTSFTRCHPPLHEFADLNQLAQGDQEKVQQCKRFLISYLREVRGTEGTNGWREDVDTALLKLYAEENHESLLDLLASDNACLLPESAPWLEKHCKYFALGLLYHYNGQDDAALQTWVRVVDGELQDFTRSDLYEYVVDFLSFCPSLPVVWKYADWALKKNQEVGVQIFTRRPKEDKQQKQMNPDDVIKYLHKYKQATVLYLEHLVLDKRIQKERFHTHLAVLYLERVLSLISTSHTPAKQVTHAREQFQRLLKESNLYQVHLLLDKVNDTDLLVERATLHGKLEEHDKALYILVHQLKSPSAAEEYCSWASMSQDHTYRQRLFHLLLSLYLSTNVPHSGHTVAAVDLLNRHAEVFDAVSVLRSLPEAWSLQLLRPFFSGALRGSMHARRTAQVALGLARSENLLLHHDRLKYLGGPVFVSEKKGCHLCHNTFSEPDCVCLPGGVPVHMHCAAQKARDSPIKRHCMNRSNHT
ncbi:transforming growth factor-beta receptor-associated protein 1 homolog [Scleropages formosus]|uniref:transforming growth factor-beta receptor-associated protein 1 homolog n=1 Tax=Scleropages formosus TaxID=113540 RepID=UPI000878CF2D|nr:transforming growth factor-beta receptor-associated protein 1 [Scleropages formosus]